MIDITYCLNTHLHSAPGLALYQLEAKGFRFFSRSSIFWFCKRYWYKYGCVFPDMMTAFIALDDCNKDNGCLQV